MTLPSMVADYDAATTRSWCRRIEDGPYASVSVGERITFRNQEQLVLLAAAAALTQRVRIIATIVVLPLHPAALVAKQMATLDVLSDGRLTVGVGVGGREHDYRAVGSSFDRRLARLDAGVAQLRRTWSGEPPFDGADPVGPPPSQAGGPPILCSSLGPASLARAARWADGLAGFTLGADPAELAGTAAKVREAWAEAGRAPAPSLMTSSWVSLGPDADSRHDRYVRDYMAFEPALSGLLAEAATIRSEAAFAAALDAAEAAGFDEFMVVPTTSDLAELDRMEAVLSRR